MERDFQEIVDLIENKLYNHFHLVLNSFMNKNIENQELKNLVKPSKKQINFELIQNGVFL